jgi:hypothetical protein
VRDAVDALLHVVQTNSARMAVKRAGGIKTIVRLFLRCSVTTHVRTKHGCLSLLASLATLAELRVRFLFVAHGMCAASDGCRQLLLVAETGLFEDVVSCLRSTQTELHRAGLTYLVCFVNDDECVSLPGLETVSRYADTQSVDCFCVVPCSTSRWVCCFPLWWHSFQSRPTMTRCHWRARWLWV